MARPREFDEDRAVDAALVTFWTNGYRATSVDDLDHAIGIGRSSFYAAFGDKRALYLRSLDRYCSSGGAELIAALGADQDLRGALSHALLSLLADDDDARARGCFMVNSVAELARTDPEVRRRAQATFEALATALEAAIRAAQARGEVPRAVDAKAAAASIMVFMQGMRLVDQAALPRPTLRAAIDGVLSVLD